MPGHHHDGHHDGHGGHHWRPFQPIVDWPRPVYVEYLDNPERLPVWVYLVGGAAAGLLVAAMTRS